MSKKSCRSSGEVVLQLKEFVKNVSIKETVKQLKKAKPKSLSITGNCVTDGRGMQRKDCIFRYSKNGL